MEFELVRRLGIYIVEVPALPSKACYVEDQGVALVRAGLDHATREVCADWLLAEVVSHPLPVTAE